MRKMLLLLKRLKMMIKSTLMTMKMTTISISKSLKKSRNRLPLPQEPAPNPKIKTMMKSNKLMTTINLRRVRGRKWAVRAGFRAIGWIRSMVQMEWGWMTMTREGMA